MHKKASGAKTDRAKLAKLLHKLDSGDVLIVFPLDRLARSTRDVLNVLDVVAKAGALDRDFSKGYADGGRPSIAPERLLRALLLQAFYTIRSER